jgi:thiol-disulfide isomerase/thioredoxin
MKSQVLDGWLTACLGGVTLVAVSLVTSVPVSADITRAALRKDAPGFSLTDSKGALVKLADYKGKVVLLDFWATWCTGCKVEIPWYVEFQKKYEGKGLASIGVAMDEEGWEKVKPYLAEHPISYPVIIGDSDVGKKFGVIASLPVTLLIDRHGKIAESHLGMVEKDAFERDISQLLQEREKP